jgi:hypothetical protein
VPSSGYVGPNGEKWEGAKRRAALRAMFAAHGRTCWFCGHAGAQDGDHLDPPSRGGAMFDPDNLRPIHGVAGCPSCGRKCNREKGDKSLADVERLVTSQDWYAR